MNTADSKIAVIIIPTYSEAGNIGELVDHIFENTSPNVSGWQLKVLIVDGNSPDMTADIIKERKVRYPDLYLIQEQAKEGIGASYAKGFRYAIDELKADVVFEFDADFQHPPEMIPVILNKIDEGYDYVLGSRKIPGGSDFKERSELRHFLTWGGAFAARCILFFPGKYFNIVTDPTTGLRATRVRGFADKLDLNLAHLYSRGFGYKMQLLAETLRLGARYVEVPLKFQPRKEGRSKFKMSTIVEVLWACARTRVG